MSFTCGKCGIELDTEGGLKRHHTRIHGPYTAQDLRSSGIEPSSRDIARSLDSGNTSIDSVIANAPETEDEAKSKNAPSSRRNNKEAKERAGDIAEFQRLRPQLVERWKRRLRIPYSLWARLADDPQIALSEKEVTEGAEMHVDFCEAMGWLKAGKVEAIIDLTLWHGGTILGRSEVGKQLLSQLQHTEEPPTEK